MGRRQGHIETVNGEQVMLGPNEQVADYKCPKCGADLVTNYGPGISITFCSECGYSEDDYD